MWHVNKGVVSQRQVLACGANCQPEVYDPCGVTRQCFGLPDNCLASRSCTSLLSYGSVEGSDPTAAIVPVDVYGYPASKYDQNSGWIGFGLSMSGAMVGLQLSTNFFFFLEIFRPLNSCDFLRAFFYVSVLQKESAVVQCAQYADGTSDVIAAYNAPGSPPNDHIYQSLPDSDVSNTDFFVLWAIPFCWKSTFLKHFWRTLPFCVNQSINQSIN